MYSWVTLARLAQLRLCPALLFEVRPLLPTLVQPFNRPGWVYEEKVDGWRMVAYKEGRTVRLVSRNG
jgi:ATP-dependent DNA ligase